MSASMRINDLRFDAGASFGAVKKIEAIVKPF